MEAPGMSQAADDTRLLKVRKLLAQAEDPAATPAEAEAFTVKAAELMARYGIDEALLASLDSTRDVVGDLIIEVPAPYAQEKATLGACLAEALQCRGVLRKHKRYVDAWSTTSSFAVHLFGHRSDLTRVEVLFTSLLLQGSRDLGHTPVPAAEHPAAFRRTWWLGFASAISHRLREVEQSAARAAEPRFQAAGTSSTLVLASRAEAAESHLARRYPRLRKAAPRYLSGGGHGHGYAAGRRADLGGGGERLVGPRSRGLPGRA